MALSSGVRAVILGELAVAAASVARPVWAGCDPVCGNGVREVGEQCDGGAYCTESCILVSIAPGCCEGGSTGGCASANGFSLNYYLYNYCLSLGGAVAVPGGVCTATGACQAQTLASPVPLCCESPSGACYDPSAPGTAASTNDLWLFHNRCEGASFGTSHTEAGATCGSAGVCTPF